MKIKINSIPEGAIVRNENFDKIGKTPFEIESSEYLNKKIFINYDGVIKEHLITESTSDIYEDLIRKEIVEPTPNLFTNSTISDNSFDQQNDTSDSVKKYSIMAAGIFVLSVLGYGGYYFFYSSNDETMEVTTNVTTVDSISKIDSTNIVDVQENTQLFSENVEVEENIISEVEESKNTPKVEEKKLESPKLDESAARNVITRAIWMENSKNISGLKNLFASNVSRYKSRNNLSKNQLGGIYEEWWDNIVSEEKQISSIIKIDENTYKAKINHRYDVDGDSEKEVIYFGIYKLNNEGKIVELYID